MKRILCLAIGLWCMGLAAAADEPPTGLTHDEAIRLGERMYRQGILPSGEPMMATVQGDIPVDSRVFSCQSCHLRSGVGSTEGTIVTLPTNWGYLSRPLAYGMPVPRTPAEDVPVVVRGRELRPAYVDETLAEALRLGLAPPDRQLNPIMPRYQLDDRDMAILIYYLKHLSAEIAPGVTLQEIHFATVISDDVPAEDRQAMLAPLEAHVSVHNSQSRWEEKRSEHGPFYHEEKDTSWRRWVLHRWELKGDRATWDTQLEEYYRQDPVFVLLGGIVSGDWKPVHAFCERHQLPCLFPCTDYPVISDHDWYTLYISKGLYKEGENAARFLRQQKEILPADGTVVQVCRDQGDGKLLADAFSENRARLSPGATTVTVTLAEEPTAAWWNKLVADHPGAILVLWLRRADLANLPVLAEAKVAPPMIVLSSSLLESDWAAVPEVLRSVVYITYPYGLPSENASKQRAVQRWMQLRNISFDRPFIQSKMYFLGWMLSEVFMHMRRNFYRDYFLDLMDMMRDQYYAIVVYPRLSFGPGQRYASKGCYVIQLGPGKDPKLIPRSEWVIY
jgi:hypothetical protein